MPVLPWLSVSVSAVPLRNAPDGEKALLRTTGEHSEIEWVSNLEKEVLQELNQTGIGPGGLGGTTTVLAVHVNTYPTHIAGFRLQSTSAVM